MIDAGKGDDRAELGNVCLQSGAIEDDGTPLPRSRNPPPPYVMQAFSIHLNYVKSCTEGAGNKKKNQVYESSSRSGCRIAILSSCYSFQI